MFIRLSTSQALLSFSRSVASASPPAQGCCGTPTPNSSQTLDEERMVEYLKELQAEKERLELQTDKTKVAHAIKLVDQGKKELDCGSPGLVVMGGDSCFEGCRFESQHRILDGHFFKYICSKNCNV